MINITNKYNYYFYSLLALLVVVLLFVSNTLSISYKEALNVFENNSLLTYITNTSLYLFGQNDIALRIPFIIFYVLSVLLMHRIHSYLLLCLFLFVDNSFAILYLALFAYTLKESTNKKDKMLWISLILFISSMCIYGFDTLGKPRAYFLDTIAIYATIFSPFLFIYFFYCIYRISFKEKEKSLIWYISITALLISFIFSFRQKVYIEDFAPYVVIAIPLMLKIFFHSYRVRLKEFRGKHNITAGIVLTMLFGNVFLTIVHNPVYLLLPNPKKHFIYKYDFIKELAQELKKNGIDEVFSEDDKLLLRLKFYGINKGNKYFITTNKFDKYNLKISIDYYNRKLYKIYIKQM